MRCQRLRCLRSSNKCGPGEFNVVTIVEWVNTQAIVAATAVMQKKYAEEGFDPSAFMQTLGVRADLGLYSKA